MDERFEAAPVGIVLARPDGTVSEINARAASLLEAEPDVSETPIGELFPASVENTVPSAFEGESVTDCETEEYYPEIDRWFELSVIPDGEGAVIYLRDVTARHSKEKHREKLHDDLDRVTITNELISDILGELVEASSREEIAATICDRLGETDIYEFAWVAERRLGGDDLIVQASSGTTGRTLTEIENCLKANTPLPEQRAIETGTPAVVQPLGEEPSVPEPIRRAAFADGLQSLLAIPLTYGSNVYGVVGIYSADQDAFSPRERASFGTVGEMAGFAVNASRHRSLLLSDTVVELTLEIRDENAPLVSTATGANAGLELQGLVPQGDGLFCYIGVSERAPEDVADRLKAQSGVRSVRVIGEYDSGGSLEVNLGEETPLGILSGQGVTIDRATYEEGYGECVVELSPTTDVRRIAESVTREYDGEVIAKRQHERELTTSRKFRETLQERLTEKQENALRTAFFADYFESPRGSTAEEVATTLGITGPTLLHHLRAGQRKLLDEFFDTPSETQR